jgi:hypothetical protein
MFYGFSQRTIYDTYNFGFILGGIRILHLPAGESAWTVLEEESSFEILSTSVSLYEKLKCFTGFPRGRYMVLIILDLS